MGAGILPPRAINFSELNSDTFITGALPSNPPYSTLSPTFLPGAGISRTAVVFLFIIPMAISSAMMAEMVAADVSPGTNAGHSF